MGRQFNDIRPIERFIGVYEIEVKDNKLYLYFQIPGLDKTRRLINPSIKTLARMLHFNDIRPVSKLDGEFMAKYIMDLVMMQPRKKLPLK